MGPEGQKWGKRGLNGPKNSGIIAFQNIGGGGLKYDKKSVTYYLNGP